MMSLLLKRGRARVRHRSVRRPLFANYGPACKLQMPWARTIGRNSAVVLDSSEDASRVHAAS